jgi:uncharacterized protein YbjT (DUF2867 family)
MAKRKVIAVVGSTGKQGGGLVRAIRRDSGSEFDVRAITRKPESDAARAHSDMGIEVVKADLDDAASVERAFEGAYGAFCMTNFWESFSPEREKSQARNAAAAAKRAGVEHVIWSTLDDTRRWIPLSDDRMPTLMGSYKVPHFDGKGEADAYFAEAGVPTTYLLTVFYWDNFVFFGAGPKRGEDGVLRLVSPMGDAKLPGIAAEDIGGCAYGIFKEGKARIGERVGIAGGHLTWREMAEGLSRALGEKVEYQSVTPETYRGFGFPGAEDMGNMYQFKRDFNEEYCASRSIERARELNPSLHTFDEWARENAKKIPLSVQRRTATG